MEKTTWLPATPAYSSILRVEVANPLCHPSEEKLPGVILAVPDSAPGTAKTTTEAKGAASSRGQNQLHVLSDAQAQSLQ